MILQAALWAVVAMSTMLIGTWIAFTFHVSSKTISFIMGIGAGALLSAVAYELFPETSRDLLSFICLALGAIVFYLGSLWLERRSAANGNEGAGAQAQAGQSIVLGALLDMVPEFLVLGMSIAVGGGLSIALFGSILIVNIPQSMGASSMMEAGGMSRRNIYLLWLLVILICAISAMAGAVLIQILPQLPGIYAMAAAAGAVLAMLTVTMIPESFKEGGQPAGLMVVLGFAFSAMLGVLD